MAERLKQDDLRLYFSFSKSLFVAKKLEKAVFGTKISRSCSEREKRETVYVYVRERESWRE